MSTTRRFTLLVALEGRTRRRIELGLHPARLPYYIRATAQETEEDPNTALVVLTIMGRDQWDTQRRLRKLLNKLTEPGQATLLNTEVVERPYQQGDPSWRSPQSRSCTSCRFRPLSTGRWGHEYPGRRPLVQVGQPHVQLGAHGQPGQGE